MKACRTSESIAMPGFRPTTEAVDVPERRGSRRLLVVLSSERSGSTLLRVLLGKHRRIVAPSELWLLRYSNFDQWRSEYPKAIHSVVEYFQLVRKPLDHEEVEAACSGKDTTAVLEWMLGELPRDHILVDKTPGYANDIESLQRSLRLPTEYIWLIRHPLGVVDSHIRLMQRNRKNEWSLVSRVRHALKAQISKLRHGGVTKDARDRERKWREQNATIHRFFEQHDAEAALVVRFADLVKNPRSILSDICDKLGIEFSPAMLDPSSDRPVRTGLGDPTYGRYKSIRSDVADSWKQRLSEENLEPETKCLMRRLGL